MTSRDHEPLTPEERDLARRLARVDGGAEPSPALDARILAAARASGNAASSPVVREIPVRRRPRFAWTAGLGVAASVLLAVGIAWQLRPQPDADVQFSEAPAAAKATRDEEPLAEVRAPEAFPASPPPPPPPPMEQAKPQQPEPVSSERAAAAPAQDARASRRFSPPPRESRQNQAQTAESGRAEAPIVFDDPSPVDALAPPAAAPIPPPPASAPAPRAAEAAAEPQPDLSALQSIDAAGAVQEETALDERERKASAEEASRDAAKQRRADSLDRIEVTGSRIRDEAEYDAGFADQPYDDEPPASADSPEVRTAWLARIRELLGEGKTDAARASLAEFHRRYPDAPLPDDLRPLLQ